MAPHPTALLTLVLCLSPRIHTHEGALERPSIRAEPSSVIPWGRPVTIVCRGAAGFELFRLHKEESSNYVEEKNSLPSETEARFHIPAMNDNTAGHYYCIYQKSKWSLYSEVLELVVSSEEASQAPTSTSALPSGAGPSRGPQSTMAMVTPSSVSTSFTWPEDPSSLGATQTPSSNSNKETVPVLPGMITPSFYILISVSVVFFLCLFLLLLFCLHRQHQIKQELPSSNDQEQRSQERLSLAVDSPVRGSPDLAADHGLPEEDGEMDTFPTCDAGGPQELTYAELDHQALMQNSQAMSPQSKKPIVEFSTYTTIARQ